LESTSVGIVRNSVGIVYIKGQRSQNHKNIYICVWIEELTPESLHGYLTDDVVHENNQLNLSIFPFFI